MAKLCGVRVDVFSIGFGPRLGGVKRGNTDYRISALPLGGYVKMAGDNPVEERSGAPDEFLSRPRWQRFLIAIAGPLTNILMTLLVLWGIYALVGMPVEAYLRQPAQVAAVPNPTGTVSGVQAGDRIVEVNGVKTPTWGKVLSHMAAAKPRDSVSLVVMRGGSQQKLSAKFPNGADAVEAVTGYPKLPLTVEDVQPGSPAQQSGLEAGDTFTAVNGHPISTWPQLLEAVRSSDGHGLHFMVLRNGQNVALDVTPKKMMSAEDGQTHWMLGVAGKVQEDYEPQGVLTAAGDAWSKSVSWVREIGDFLSGLVSGKISARELAGPVGIVQLSGRAAESGPVTFLVWIAYISLNLGLLNLLPIPIMDGGHVLMLAVEGSLRHDLSIAFKERFVQVGLVFLLGLFAFVFYNDILRLINH
jgi:regulator of sigma E protease